MTNWQLSTLLVILVVTLGRADAENNVQNAARTIKEGDSSGRPIFNLLDELVPAGSTREQYRYNFRKSGVFDPASIFQIEGDWLAVGRSPPDRERLCADRLCDCSRGPQCRVSFYVDVARINEDYVWRVLNVTINVEDVNDQSPAFAQPRYTLNLHENDAQAHAELPVATDLDWNARICKYELRDAEDSAERFSIVKRQGERYGLAVKQPLNREEKDSYAIQLLAFECSPLGALAKNGSTEIIVMVKDIDDNAPYFEQSVYTVSVSEEVPENSASILTLVAHDIDENPRINYSLQPDSPFALRVDENDNAQLEIVKPLDFELQKQYNLTVTAHSSLHNATAQVIVNVVDANDNAPEIRLFDVQARAFCNEPQVDECVLIRENLLADTPIARVHVTDGDASRDFGYVQCALQADGDGTAVKQLPTSSPNEKDARFTLLTGRPFDRERENKIRATIECYNLNRDEQQSTTRTIMIVVGDVNDNAPSWRTERKTHIRVTENNAINQFIGDVRAFDPDLNENGSVSYRLLPSNDASMVNIVSNGSVGYLYARSVFDRERRTNISVQVMAFDGGSPSLNSSVMELVFDIEDENDNVPQFENRTYLFSILETNQLAQENHVVCRLIGKVRAVDADASDAGKLEYFIQSITTENRVPVDLADFRIEADGSLSVCAPLDRESFEQLTIVVLARDLAQHVTTATVSVQIIDVNDCLPTLRGSTAFEINDDTHPGAIIAQLSAEDRDTVADDRVYYRLVENPSGLFKLDPTGALKLARTLTNLDAERGNFRLVVELSSGAQQGVTAPKYPLTVRVRTRPTHSVDSTQYTDINSFANGDKSIASNSQFLLIVFLVTLAGTLCIIILVVILFLKRDTLFRPSRRTRKSDEEAPPEMPELPDDVSFASADHSETQSIGDLKCRRDDGFILHGTSSSKCSDRINSPSYGGYETVMNSQRGNVKGTGVRDARGKSKSCAPQTPTKLQPQQVQLVASDRPLLTMQRSNSLSHRMAQRGGTGVNTLTTFTMNSNANNVTGRKARLPMLPSPSLELANVHCTSLSPESQADCNTNVNVAGNRVVALAQCRCPECTGTLPLEMSDTTYGTAIGVHNAAMVPHMAMLPNFGAHLQHGIDTESPCYQCVAADSAPYTDYSSTDRSEIRNAAQSDNATDRQKSTDSNGNALEYRTGEGSTSFSGVGEAKTKLLRQLIVAQHDSNAPQTKVVPTATMQKCSTNMLSVMTMLPESHQKGSSKTLRSIYNEASNV